MRIAESNNPAAKNIGMIIKEAGLKQMVVAERAGYTQQEFSDMLNGRKLIKACDIPRIAKALGKEPNDLYAAGEESESA